MKTKDKEKETEVEPEFKDIFPIFVRKKLEELSLLTLILIVYLYGAVPLARRVNRRICRLLCTNLDNYLLGFIILLTGILVLIVLCIYLSSSSNWKASKDEAYWKINGGVQNEK